MPRRSVNAPTRSAFLRGVLVALLALGLGVPTVAIAENRSADEVGRELDETRDQASRLEDDLGSVRSAISAAEEELAQIGARLAEARERLETAEAQVVLAEEALVEAEEERDAAAADHERAEALLEATEQELEREEALLVDHIVESFKYGTVGAAPGAMTFEVLRRAEDPNAFAVGMKQVKVVVDNQESVVRRVFDLREERTRLTDEAAAARARATQAANEAADTLRTVEELRDEAAQLAAQIAADEERQRELLANLEAEAADTQERLQAIEQREAELRREYEERRAAELQQAGGGSAGPPVDGGHCPVQGARAGSSFINDWGFPRSGGRVHQGNDIFAPRGTPVVAIQDGTVIRMNTPSSPTLLGGVTVTYRTADGSEWYNAHLDSIADGISVGAAVAAGQQIGTVGNTGNARTTPPHLHLGRRYGGSWVNPWPSVSRIC